MSSPVAALIPLLKTNPSSQTASQVAQEASLLEDVAVQYSSTYDFVSASNPASRAFGELFDALVRHRLLHSAWRVSLRPDHLLRLLQCCRLLSRDNVLRQRLVEAGGVKVISELFRDQAAEHFSGTISSFQIEVLTECASIIKRLAGDEWGLAALTAEEAHLTLLQLLSSTDPAVLPLVLVALIGFAAHRTHYVHVTSPAALETLLRIVTTYDLPFKRLAADLLALLARREAVVSELLAASGLGRLVGQLAPGVDGQLAHSLLRVLCYVAADAGAVAEMYHVGSIPVLMSLVGSAVKELAASPTHSCLPPGRVTELQLVATCLTRLAEHDECAAQVRACNGVTLLGKLLLVQPTKGEDGRPSDKSSREVLSLKAYVFRALRYLFSVERNRKMFKRLFPPDLFAAFIDAGHYNAQLPAYAPLVTHFEDLSEKQRAGVAAALDDVSVDREGSGLRHVGGYVILEMLGKGAFGAVYKARKSRGESLVALKELPLSDIGLFGATESEVTAGVGRMCKEVEILSSLSHPNIVQYYESFSSGPYLYIAMELVEGVSLLDHLQGLEGKGRRMAEAEIWQVLIAVVLALNYIHGVKKIVHRDLTPANIVLGQGPEGLRHTKIADFGLAKRLSSSVVAQSMVGTMPYTCPEIIQQEPYSEKADVWSLGCVTYHMMMLRPPFDGTNPLSVAHKIVEGAYEPPCDPPAASGAPPYSPALKRLVGVLMTPDPNKRPSISEVGALVSGQLMASLERAAAQEQRMSKALQMERTALQQHRRLGSAAAAAAAGGGGEGLGLAVGSPLRAVAVRKAAGGAPGQGAGAAAGGLAAADVLSGGSGGGVLMATSSPRVADGPGALERFDSLNSAAAAAAAGGGGKGTLVVYGYVRSAGLSANQLVTVPGAGDFRILSIHGPPDPNATPAGRAVPAHVAEKAMEVEAAAGGGGAGGGGAGPVVAAPNPEEADQLVRENVPAPGEEEQTWPTEEDMEAAAAERRTRKRRVPEGTSEYQAAWIMDDVDYGTDEEEDEEEDEEDPYGMMEDGEGAAAGGSGKGRGRGAAAMEDDGDEAPELEPIADDDDAATDAGDAAMLMDEDDEEGGGAGGGYAAALAAARAAKAAARRGAEGEADQLEFPDEVDVPLETPARVRFQKYRGLKSMRTSPWDPKESLPPDYARVFAFENFKRAHKRAKEAAARATDDTDPCAVSPGTYVAIRIADVPAVAAERLAAHVAAAAAGGAVPLTVFGLMQHEAKMSVVNFAFRKATGYSAPLANKEQLLLVTGLRTFTARPVLSTDDPGADKHRMEKFLHPGQHVVGSVYAPIMYPPLPLLAFKLPEGAAAADGSGAQLAAVGALRGCDPDRVNLKRIMLTGTPVRVSRRRATVRFMFHNPEDVRWFKPVELSTKYGRRGRIQEPLGTHGAMKCLFDSPLQQRDTVCMPLYKRVFPKWPADLTFAER